MCELTASGLVAGGGCSTASWSSSTTCELCVGECERAAGDSSVTVGAVAGTGLSVYSFDGPVVCIAMVNSPHRAGRSSVTVSGLSFGSVELTASGLVAGGGCSTASWSSSTSRELCVGECDWAAGDIECDRGGCGRDWAVCVQLRWTCGVHCDGEQSHRAGGAL